MGIKMKDSKSWMPFSHRLECAKWDRVIPAHQPDGLSRTKKFPGGRMNPVIQFLTQLVHASEVFQEGGVSADVSSAFDDGFRQTTGFEVPGADLLGFWEHVNSSFV